MRPSLMDILNQVKAGDMTVAEGVASLETVDGQEERAADTEMTASPISGQVFPAEEAIEPEIGWWKYAWLIVLLAGSAVFVLGAWMVSWAYPSGHWFWFYCALLPLFLGLIVLLIGAWSRFARWVHVRVQEVGKSQISISMPIPIFLISLGIRLFGSKIKGMEGQNPADVAALLTALGKTHDPISVEVDEKDGSRVRVYIL